MLPDGCAYLGSHPGLQEQVCEVGFHVPRTPHGLLGSFGVDDAATSAALNTLPKTRDNLRSNITCAKRAKQGVCAKQLVRGFMVHDRAGKAMRSTHLDARLQGKTKGWTNVLLFSRTFSTLVVFTVALVLQYRPRCGKSHSGWWREGTRTTRLSPQPEA